MSKLTQYFNKPMSVTADVIVCTGLGAAAFVIYQGALPLVPVVGAFTSLIASPLAGVTAAAAYIRARENLRKPPS